MRTLALLALLAAASPAAAQPLPGGPNAVDPIRDAEAGAQATLDRQRVVAADNLAAAADARARADQAIRELEAGRQQRRSWPSGLPGAEPSTSAAYASMPDDRLARSNARTAKASEHR